MRKTFTAMMPDEVGIFLSAEEIFTSLKLNITRLSYNKSVDIHTLFIEVEGDKTAIDLATEKLSALGYLSENKAVPNIILFEFRLENKYGALKPLLRLISEYNFNISYMSSQESDTNVQALQLGLLIENDDAIASFIKSASAVCDLKIINYNQTGLTLDNTVFYMNFVNTIAKQHNLSESEKQSLLIDANLIMEALMRKHRPPQKTFEYIRKFSEHLSHYSGEQYTPRITAYSGKHGLAITLIEPPCGSNIAVIETDSEIICVDSGFACYKNETLAHIRKSYSAFDKKPKHLLLTHVDVDHVGLIDAFNTIHLSQKSNDNFVCEHRNDANIRETSAQHAPYVRISKILSHYQTPALKNMHIIGKAYDSQEPVQKIDNLAFSGLQFEVYETKGGHLPGSIVFIERYQKIMFCGDVFVNSKGFTHEQAKFNKLAPYLVTNVENDAALAFAEREATKQLLDEGQWLVIGGHGSAMNMMIP